MEVIAELAPGHDGGDQGGLSDKMTADVDQHRIQRALGKQTAKSDNVLLVEFARNPDSQMSTPPFFETLREAAMEQP